MGHFGHKQFYFIFSDFTFSLFTFSLEMMKKAHDKEVT